MRRPRLLYQTLGLGACLALGACSAAPLDTSPAERPAVTPAAATLHRLTRAQYQESARTLLGDWIQVPQDLEVDTALQGYASVGASALTISPQAAEQYEAAALSLAQQAFSDAARRQALLGCAPTAADDDCARAFLDRFGRRALRRPLEAKERDALLALSRSIGAALKSPLRGLEHATAALLQSPHFLFRVERGEPDPDRPGRLRYTGYEMAARLSYFLWGTGPDDELLQAAERGDLTGEAGLRAQAERLLQAPRARAALGAFFGELLQLDRLDLMSKDRALYPQFTPALAAAMRGEVLGAVDDLVFGRDGDVRELLDGDRTFVNAELAALYGLKTGPAPGAGFAKVQLPGGKRGGLLGMAAILSLNAHETLTSPTRRGKFIRQQLLCQDIPPPPPGVVTSLDAPAMGQGPVTLRERLRRHRESPACRSCHERMDPLGLGLENFDAVGAFREKDSGLPIDASADLDGAPFDGPRQLGALLKGSPSFSLCLVRQLYRHATGHLEGPGEEDALRDLWTRFQDGHRVRRLALELVLSDGFRAAGAPQ